MKAGIDYIGIITPFFCHDGKGNFLFYKRGKESNDEIGKWDSSGGTLLFGEQPEDGMRRKLQSQYNCTPIDSEQLPTCSIVLSIDGVINHWLAVPFIVLIDPSQAKIGEPHKMEEIVWFKLAELPTSLHPGARYVLEINAEVFQKYAQ